MLPGLLLAGGLLVGVTAPVAADTNKLGQWSDPFAEPTINGQHTDEVCIEEAQDGDDHEGRKLTCKPAATSIAVLGGDEVVYWNGLEDTEEVENGIALEYGEVSITDQVRILDIDRRIWTTSTPDDADVGDSEEPNELLPGLATRETYNDDVLFCAALSFGPDGSVLTIGGTTYYAEPDLPGRHGVAELEGSKKTKRFDPRTDTWTELGSMRWGRWYPSTVNLANGDLFVAGGVSKLIKPVYTDRDPQDSGRNVVQTETFDFDTAQWNENPDSADRSLPLYPRLHLLPNGHVYYNGAGQVFNPSGQAYDEAVWNLAAAYDPDSQSWQELGVPGIGTPAPGFRGSTFSIMLPLRPDADGKYASASFLTAGGILGTTPGTYVAVTDARIDTVDTNDGSLSSASTGSLHQPRWYGTGVLLPTGEVLAVNGASADEVVGPGTAIPVKRPELWNPETGEWTVLAEASEARTYHNSAVLLSDGRVLVGGHDPISTLYGSNRTLLPGTTTPGETRNPTFEILSPPYLFRGDRPVIEDAPARMQHGRTFDIRVSGAEEIDSVVLMRRAALTHIVDGGQRSVELPVVARNGDVVTVQAPPHGAVAPAGPYMLFVNEMTAEGPVPSEAAEITVAGTVAPPDSGATTGETNRAAVAPTGSPGATAAAASMVPPKVDVDAAGGVPVAAGLAFHEGEELLAQLAGHRHDHGAQVPGGSSRPALPIGAMVVATVAAAAFVTHRRRGSATTM